MEIVRWAHQASSNMKKVFVGASTVYIVEEQLRLSQMSIARGWHLGTAVTEPMEMQSAKGEPFGNFCCCHYQTVLFDLIFTPFFHIFLSPFSSLFSFPHPLELASNGNSIIAQNMIMSAFKASHRRWCASFAGNPVFISIFAFSRIFQHFQNQLFLFFSLFFVFSHSPL